MNRYLVDILVFVPILASIFFMLRMIRRRKKLLTEGQVAEGIVMKLREEEGYFYPTIRFRTLQGQDVEKEYQAGFIMGKLSTGDKLPLYYDINRPKRFALQSREATWVPYIIIATALVCMAVYLIFFRK